MTVDDCVRNFGCALRALVPFSENAGIGWRREDAYDQWDEIATSLFRSLVQEPLRWVVPEPERERVELPPYDLLLERYTAATVIEVALQGSTGLRVFHALGTRDEPFDVCECRVVDESGLPIADELESQPLDQVRFRLRHRAEDGRVLVVESDTEVGA